MKKRRQTVAGLAASLVAIGAWLLLRFPSGNDVAATDLLDPALSADLPASRRDRQNEAANEDTGQLSDPVLNVASGETNADCTPLDPERRKHLGSVARDWYGEMGDAAARRYWPYASVDNETLRRAADAGDPEAMFQFGMNMLWKATRATGEHWEPQGSRLHESVPAREQADPESLKLAATYLGYAVANGKVFAYRQLAATQARYPVLLRKMLHRDDPGAEQQLIDATIAAWEMLPNYLVAELPEEKTSMELDSDTRELARGFAEDWLLGFELLRNDEGLLPEVNVPRAVRELSADDRCIGSNFRQSFR